MRNSNRGSNRTGPLPLRAMASVLVLAACVLLSACFLAAAGAGAGGAIFLTSRGVKSLVAASPDNVVAATDRAFEDLNLERTAFAEEDSGRKRKVTGKPNGGDLEVTVELEQADENSTNVEVTARTGTLSWDKEFARGVLERIIRNAGEE